MSSEAPNRALEQAYVACGYLLGRRGDELMAGLVGASPRVPLATELGHPDQQQRASALAEALTQVVRAIHEQRLL